MSKCYTYNNIYIKIHYRIASFILVGKMMKKEIIFFLASFVCLAFSFELKNHDYESMLMSMESIARKCPEITHLYALPGGKNNKTSQGRYLAVLVISDNPKVHEAGYSIY